MNTEALYLIKHEIVLVVLILFHLIADLYERTNSRKIVLMSTLLFGMVTVVGFLPTGDGTVFGSMYQMDEMRWLLKNILCVLSFIVLLQATTWLNDPANRNRIGTFNLCLFSTLLGMFLMISSGNFLMLYLGLELATLPLALLAASDKEFRRSAEAGMKLLMSSAVSSALLLFGLSFIYGVFGTFNFIEISVIINDSALFILALIFLVSGLGFKLSLVPFHLWTADVYEGAPLAVTTYFSVISKGAALFTLMIVLYRVFGALADVWTSALYILSVVTMAVGNLFALRQKNMKRFLAFSSITQAGFMLLGFMLNSSLGITTIVYFMLIYGLSNLAVFGVLSIVHHRTGREGIDDFNGFYSSNPGLSLIVLVSLFSLAGIPPTAGFFGKFFLFTAAAAEGMYILVFIAVVNATVSLYYYLLVVKAIFINQNDTPIAPLITTWYERIALTICVVGVVFAGFFSGIFEFIESIAL
jgi:NADH-quinone oxidoreductase subunit N